MLIQRSSRAATLVLLVASAALSQPVCPVSPAVDDGFAVGCCGTPAPWLPVFPATTMVANWGVFTGCNLTNTQTCTVTIGSPNWVLCDAALIPITISGLPGVPAVSAYLVGKHARTWSEPDPSGVDMNVWRVLVNGDIFFPGSTACPPGPCLPPGNGAPYALAAHFVGHIDYACDSTVAGGRRMAFSLSHLPGCFLHAPFSTVPVPALAASNRSYHLVGPAPFNFGPVVEPQGNLTGDSARPSTFFTAPFIYQCHGETDRFLGGSLTTATADCFCGPLPNGPWKHQNLAAHFDCSGIVASFASLPIPGTPLAPTGFTSFTLGSWAGGASFPQNRSLVVCLGVVTNSSLTCGPVLYPFHVMTGVGTTTTVPGTPFTSLLGTPPGFPARTFIDLQNMLPLSLWPSGGGLPVPGIGSMFLSDLVLSVNIP